MTAHEMCYYSIHCSSLDCLTFALLVKSWFPVLIHWLQTLSPSLFLSFLTFTKYLHILNGMPIIYISVFCQLKKKKHLAILSASSPEICAIHPHVFGAGALSQLTHRHENVVSPQGLLRMGTLASETGI